MRPWRGITFHRTRGVWIAFLSGLLGCVAITLLLLAPLLSLIGTSATVIPVVAIPVARITVALIGGFALSAGLLTLSLVSRSAVLSWILATIAVALVLAVSLYPAVAVALVAVDSVGEVIPFITEWIDRIQNPV